MNLFSERDSICYHIARSLKKILCMSQFEEISKRLSETLSSANREKMRLKRRRLIDHFQGVENIANAAFTISSEEVRESVVGGFFLRLNGKNSSKSLPQAHEGYCEDTAHAHFLSPVLHALSFLYHLGLEGVPAVLHITSPRAAERCLQLFEKQSPPMGLIEESLCFFRGLLPKIEVVPCFKGPFFEKMQTKMYMLKHRSINDVVALDFEVVARYALGTEE